MENLKLEVLDMENSINEIACSIEGNDMKEFIYGVPYMMSPTSRNHGLIISNVMSSFRRQLKGRQCSAFQDGVRCNIPKNIDPNPRRYYEPDVFVACNPIWEKESLVNAPNLVVEVISEESLIRDSVVKLDLYKKLGITEYIKISQDGIVNIYTLKDNEYDMSELLPGETHASIAVENLTLEYEDIYDDLIRP